MSLCSQQELSGKYYEKHDHRPMPLHCGGMSMGGGEGRGEGREEGCSLHSINTHTHTHHQRGKKRTTLNAEHTKHFT